MVRTVDIRSNSNLPQNTNSRGFMQQYANAFQPNNLGNRLNWQPRSNDNFNRQYYSNTNNVPHQSGREENFKYNNNNYQPRNNVYRQNQSPTNSYFNRQNYSQNAFSAKNRPNFNGQIASTSNERFSGTNYPNNAGNPSYRNANSNQNPPDNLS